MFLNDASIRGSWQAFERLICRYLTHAGFSGTRLVGQKGDKGADIITHKAGRRWLVQAKRWKNKIGCDVVDETLRALKYYRAEIPVIVTLNGFQDIVLRQQQQLMAQQIPLQLWNGYDLVSRASKLPDEYPKGDPSSYLEKRTYQEEAIQQLLNAFYTHEINRALVVMATGLGKTHVACEFIRRIENIRPIRVLVLAHTNTLVYQLEKSFWKYLKASHETLVWNGYEPQAPEEVNRAPYVFACLNTVASFFQKSNELDQFDIVLVDECHHVGDDGMYSEILKKMSAGKPGGPFLVGVTATPWRPDESDLRDYFGNPVICVDLITGLKKGFLTNVDYRMYTDNIDWQSLHKLKGKQFSPKKINRTLFISNWDDAVVLELQKAWSEQQNPRAIVFCGTIDHALTMRDRINALSFCRAEAVYSKTKSGANQDPAERNRILCDFHDGAVHVVCAVDIFNEGVDVPDVNIVVFQRVTHSRRIFIQQLGRGLRLSEGKEKVLVLDFVSDIRRFAAGIDLKDSLVDNNPYTDGKPITIRLPNKVSFCRVGGEDPKTESFLRQWLNDVAAIENADEDAAVLKFPPHIEGA
ncbi:MULTISPECIES: DEAD/DEAH box helicase family protein [unclassified Maridesulfovibrio]|uniref:DEAD/DEAH box helicase family protein n=1 Tax=unclassified Maridesulfovibrio TaxID=2794999 RepID=UPI003B3F3FD9